MPDTFSVAEIPGGDSNVAAVDIPVSDNRWEWWLLVRGDVHWDNPRCDRELEQKHLDQAVARGAGILDVGDLFCAMQPRQAFARVVGSDGAGRDETQQDCVGRVPRGQLCGPAELPRVHRGDAA